MKKEKIIDYPSERVKFQQAYQTLGLTNIFLSVREFDTLLSMVSLGVSQYFLIGTISREITSYQKCQKLISQY